MGSLMGATYLSVADTVWTLSSVYYGEEDKNALDELQKSAFIHGMNLTIFVAVILVAHPQIFASIYIGRNNPETLALASQSVRLFAVCLPMYFVAYMFDDYLIIRI